MPPTNLSFTDAVTITIPANLPSLIGPQLVGLVLNWGLLGVLGVQVYIYYLCFPRDSRYIKTLVYTLFIMEIVQTCMLTSDAWQWLIKSWGRPDDLESYQLSYIDIPILAGAISSAVQIFFAWRVYMLGRSKILSITIVLVSLMQGSAGIGSGIQVRQLPSFVEIAKLHTVVSVWLGGSAAVDIIIAVSMTYFLTRSKNGFYKTNYVITRLVRLTIETGSMTATVATVDVILFNTFKKNNLHICPAMVLAKLYTNTLMVVFNNRIFMQRPTTSGTSSMNPSEYYGARLRETMLDNGPRSVEITKTVEVNSFGDTLKDSENVRNIPLSHISIQSPDPVERPSGKIPTRIGGAEFD